MVRSRVARDNTTSSERKTCVTESLRSEHHSVVRLGWQQIAILLKLCVAESVLLFFCWWWAALVIIPK